MTIEEVVKEYKEIFEGEPWHGEALLNTLEGISFQLVNYKPREDFHSIAELLNHLLAWRKFVLEKLHGNQEYDIEINSPQDWEQHIRLESLKEWRKLIEEVKSSQQEIEKTLSGKKDEWLLQYTPGKNYSNEYMMMGIIHHDVYHAGQIRLIRKMAEGKLSLPEAD